MCTAAMGPRGVPLIVVAALGLSVFAMVVHWCLSWRKGFSWDGSSRQFNWHPVLMLTGPVVLYGLALLSYRFPCAHVMPKFRWKVLHAGLQAIAFLLTVVGLVAVFDFHNAQKIPNMYSLHSWFGLAAVLLFTLQGLLGLSVFFFPSSPTHLRSAAKPLHVFFGIFIYCIILATAGMGITEKLIFSLKKTNRTLPYSDSPPESLFVNALGMLVMAYGGCVLFIVTRPQWQWPQDDHREVDSGS
uniref:plasma membrane ascorbate-dependent reductase CYBRD1-like isoform X1 n=1 Tax=Myxine glutinosa TaxID=7769 RepID=UPI00358EADC4